IKEIVMQDTRLNPSVNEIRQTAASIRISWTEAERQQRRQEAMRRQIWMYENLLPSRSRDAKSLCPS
ncbi:MAG: hypothetical protein KDA71_02545, partial [Planctomycetales bacterium]|nr:hypothetical protein [Planctomycetales bacterium]